MMSLSSWKPEEIRGERHLRFMPWFPRMYHDLYAFGCLGTLMDYGNEIDNNAMPAELLTDHFTRGRSLRANMISAFFLTVDS